MDDLLGPNLLLEHDKLVATESIIKGKALILLYFSASWCPPCKTFTPILSEFYKTCCIPNNVEIIFVSSDNDMHSFNTYFSSMPWTALPMTSLYRQNLGKLLQINSIPQLVVLDAATGHYVTNNARSSVMSVSQNVSMGMDLIQSWKSVEAVPIEEADLSLLSSIYSKVKSTFGFGSKKESSQVSDNDDGASSTIKVPASLLLSFFQDSTRRLDSFPNQTTRQQLLEINSDIESSSIKIPISLVDQRKLLLKEQMEALNDAMSSQCLDKSQSSEDGEDDLSLDLVQTCLQELGAKDTSRIDGSDDEIEEVLANMAKMNDSARLAFARSVLCSEIDCNKLLMEEYGDSVDELDDNMTNLRGLCQNEEDGQMDHTKLIEFCSLCMTAIKLPEVKKYFKDGSDMFPATSKEVAEEDETDQDANSAPPMVSQRIIQLQHTMLRAVGYEPKYGSLEIRRHMMEQGNEQSDSHNAELFVIISNFLTAIQDVGKEVMMDSTQVTFSDQEEGGVTRIVSIRHSEKTLNKDGELESAEGEAPSNTSMGQRSEEQMKQEFAMAQQASLLQKEILEELKSMSDEDREKKLKEAKMVHEIFMKEALEKPPGPERVQFLQTVGSGKQKMLLMHKLWSVMSQE